MLRSGDGGLTFSKQSRPQRRGGPGLADETVAEAANGGEVPGGGAELGAKAAHVRIDGTAMDVGVNVSNVAQELVARLDAIAPFKEEGEELEFSRSQGDGLTANAHFVGGFVDEQISEPEALGFSVAFLAAFFEDTTNAKKEFTGTEGFYDVVGCAELETENAVDFACPRADDDDRDVSGPGISAKDFAQFEAVKIREHEVEDDDIRQKRSRLIDATGGCVRGHDTESANAEIKPDEFESVRFVVNNENGRSHHSGSLGRSCYGYVANVSLFGKHWPGDT